MTEKIKWYKEVLELEPNSKVFFPLARMLADEGQYDEAVSVLEHGLERHAEFLEARLFLIELLYKCKGSAACSRHVTKLGSMFAEYAGFWRAWAACLSAGNGSADTGTVLKMLAAYFMKGDLSLHAVLDRGITAILQENQQEDLPGQPVRAEEAAQDLSGLDAAAAPETQSSAAAPVSAVEAPQTVAAQLDSLEPFEEDYGEKFDPAAAMAADEAAQDIPVALETAADSPRLSAVAEGDDGEEPFSLRTRSMAEVLAEQGDVKGALDIYHELAAAAVSPEEKADLQQRIVTLNARLNSIPEAPAAEVEQDSAKGKEKLISMLEALAQRVEARAQN